MKTGPTTTMETVSVVRPLKIIALICLAVAVILLVVALCTTTWLQAGDFKTGLFVECTRPNPTSQYPNIKAPRVPTGAPEANKCHSVRYRGKVYIQVVAALLLIAGVVTCIAIFMTVFGLTSRNPNQKYLFYRVAMYLALIAVLCELIGLVVFPVCFYFDMRDDGWNMPSWEFDWSYGVAWGAALFTFGSSLLLICDKEHYEIYYKEKTVYTAAPKEPSTARV